MCRPAKIIEAQQKEGFATATKRSGRGMTAAKTHVAKVMGGKALVKNRPAVRKLEHLRAACIACSGAWWIVWFGPRRTNRRKAATPDPAPDVHAAVAFDPEEPAKAL
jgi:hypothetical protein